ncbi:immunoglobulin-like domain-containing protein, partial [Listeria booriae]
SDTEDGDLTDRIDIDSSNVDMTQAGTYAVEYSVTDSDNNTTK